MKKTLKIVGVLILLLILCRGVIYRLVIKYKEVGLRSEVEIVNPILINKIKYKSEGKEIDFNKAINISNSITKEQLKFTRKKTFTNPNELIETKKTNCIGYAAMFNSILNYLIENEGLETEIEATHKIGKLYLLRFNLHQLFKSQFFKNHDYNEIKNLKTGKTIFVDPSVSDCLKINRVSE